MESSDLSSEEHCTPPSTPPSVMSMLKDQPPVFSWTLDNAEMTENETLQMEASVEPSDDPKLVVQWLKNGAPLYLRSGMRTSFECGLATLDINGLRMDDSGIYSCVAKNDYGEATTTASVKVVVHPSTPPESRLMSLPVELIQNFILPKLNYEELLRIRRVSTQIKISAEKVLGKKFKDVVREINQTSLSFQNYLRVNLPTTSIYLNNSSSSIFQDPGIPEFLRLHGNQITHLKVELFACCSSEHELHFYSSLPNLKSLEIQRIEVPEEEPRFPPNFQNLQTLKLNVIQGPSVMACREYAWTLIQFCEHLEFLKSSYTNLNQIRVYIEQRGKNYPDLPNLRFYDMENLFDKFERDLFLFNTFVPLCFEYGIKLLNVPSYFIFLGLGTFRKTPEFTTPIVSLENVYNGTFYAELPSLEKLTIRSTSRSSFFEWSREHERDRINGLKWPQLKQVDLTIDGAVRRRGIGYAPAETTALLNFLFDSERRSNGIEDLAIRYKKYYRYYDNVYLDEELRRFPWVRKLTATCPLLTKLTLEKWKGYNKVVIKLLEGFPLLEELVLEACEHLGDSAFVDGQRAFFNLRNLKKFSLRRLHLMPKITDLAFENVFKNLRIKQFVLTSGRPLKSITVAGIESLIDGDFNSSVEKFPFHGWSLDGISAEAFEELKLKFRASHML